MKIKKKSTKQFVAKPINNKHNVNEDYKRVISFIIVLLIIGLLLTGVFFLNGKYVSKDMFQNTTTTTTTAKFDPNTITVSTMFKISDKNYYVLLYDASDDLSSFLYEQLALNYENDDIPLYTIHLDEQMNAKYYNKDKDTVKKPTKVSEVSVNGPTIYVFKKGKITECLTTKDDIVAKLTEVKENK